MSGISSPSNEATPGFAPGKKASFSLFPQKVFFISRQLCPLRWQEVSSDSFVWDVQDFLILRVREAILALFLEPNTGRRDTRYQGKQCQ